MRHHEWVRAFSLTTIVAVFVIAVAAPASAGESGWGIRVEGVRVSPNLDYRVYTEEGIPIDATDQADTGLGITLSYRYSDHLGLELGFLQASPGVRISTDYALGDVTSSFSDDLSMRSVIAAFAFHLTPTHAVDFYVSPMIVSTSFGDLHYRVEVPGGGEDTLDIDVRNDFGWGIGLGAEVPIGSTPWRGYASLRYLDGALDLSSGQDDFEDTVDFDSVVVTLGIGYQF